MGLGIAQEFENAPNSNGFGVVTGTSSLLQFPPSKVLMVRFKGNPSIPGTLNLGNSGAAVFPLAPGDDTGWVAANDLGDFWYSGTGSVASYWYQA